MQCWLQRPHCHAARCVELTNSSGRNLRTSSWSKSCTAPSGYLLCTTALSMKYEGLLKLYVLENEAQARQEVELAQRGGRRAVIIQPRPDRACLRYLLPPKRRPSSGDGRKSRSARLRRLLPARRRLGGRRKQP